MSQSQSRKFADHQAQLEKFERLLRIGNREEILAAWKKSGDLQTLFSGGELDVVRDEYELHFTMTSFALWYRNLFQVSHLKLDSIVESMLAKQEKYASWFYGSYALNVSKSAEPEVRFALPKELLSHFGCVLRSQSVEAVSWFWKNNDALERSLLALTSSKRKKWVELAKECGYALSFSEEGVDAKVKLAIMKKDNKRKADSSPEIEPSPKRQRLDLQVSQEPEGSPSSQPEKVKRYYLRGMQITHFKIPAPLRRQPSYSSLSSQPASQSQLKKSGGY